MAATAPENLNTNSGEQPELDETEAERLFAEAAAVREGKETPAGRPADQANAEAGAATTQDDDEDEGTTGEGNDGDVEGQSGGSEGAAAAAATSGESDVWADAKPEHKAAFEAAEQARKEAEQKFKSREGREAALQRQIAELKRQGGTAEETQPRKPLKDLLASDELKTVAEEYPDFKALIDTLSTVAERVDGVEQQVGEVRNVAASAGSAAEETALTAAVPNWLELAADERFLAWVDDQPRKVRDTVTANWDGITNAPDAAEVFKGFAKSIAPATTAAETEETDSGGKPGKRERQASSAKAAKVTGPTSAGGESDDPEVLFKQMAAKKDRERGIKI